MAKKYQLAIQGGGARLADLLIAVEVVQRFEDEKRIKITRIAGTSAGAIAAAILACRKVPEARRYLAEHAPRITGRILPGGIPSFWRLIFNVVRGNPIGQADVLREEMTALFSEILRPTGAMKFGSLVSQASLDELGLASRELFVVTANLATRDKHVYMGETAELIESLLNSCAIPLVFKGMKDLRANPYVDGCFCENLPSEELSKDFDTYGEVISISFPNRQTGQVPTSPLGLVAQLITTSMNNSVQRAKRQLPTHALLTIDTDIAPLDFSKAFDSKVRRSDFELIRREAEDWLVKNLEQSRQKSLVPIFPGNEGVEALMGELYEWYVKSQAAVPKRSLSHTLVVTAHCLRTLIHDDEVERPDEIEKWYHFSPKDVPMNCFHLEIGSSERGVIFTRQHMIEVFDPEGNSVQIRTLPTIDRTAHDSASNLVYRGYLVLFEPSLPPMTDAEVEDRGCYRLRYVTEVPGAMHPLSATKKDYILMDNTNIDLTDTVNIVFVAPTVMAYDAVATVSGGSANATTVEMTQQDLAPFHGRRPPNFTVRGWKTKDFRKNTEMRVDLERK